MLTTIRAAALAFLLVPSLVSAQFTPIDASYFGTPAMVGVDPFVVTEPAVIGFDLLPDGSPITTPNAITGLLFGSAPLTSAFEAVGIQLGADDVAVSQPSAPSGIGAISLPNTLAPNASLSFPAPIDITFVHGAGAAGIWVADGPTNKVTATFRDPHGAEITTLIAEPSSVLQFLGIQSEVPIGSMQVTTAFVDDYYAEDLHFRGFSICSATPVRPCLAAAKGSFGIDESKAGSEKLTLKISGFASETTQSGLGDPVAGTTRYDVCIYDGEDDLVGALSVAAAGETCGAKAKPCWKATGTKGWLYKDASGGADGVKVLGVSAGAAGKGKALVVASNNAKKGQDALPLGLTGALAGASSARVRVLADDGACFDAALGAVEQADAVRFRATVE